MKQPKLFLLAVAALVGLASCTSDVTEGLSDASKRADGPFPVTFEAYTQRGTTRAGAVGELDIDMLKDAAAGFGVFAYYTNADDYTSGSTPNFMYNQQVKFEGGAFSYSPLRYWPNEYGQTAQSEDIDKVSFFAYAPYVEVDPKTGYLSDPGTDNEDATWGITGTTRNTYSGDPLVKYIASFESGKSVDLCWGVYNEGSSGWSTMNGKQTTTDGLPWLNVQHAQSVDQKLKFTFRHATAKLTVNVDTKYDDTTTPPADGATKVYVRSVTFTGMAAQGALNLNNAKAGVPLWMNYSGTGWPESGQSVTVYDGRRDGYEGTSGAEASNETTLGLNPTIISNDGNTTAGVTGDDDVSLFSGSSVYVIPTGEKVKLTIVYDVETAVDDLPGYLSDGTTPGTSIENRITKELMLDGGTALVFEGGKAYTLNLHLGLNSVKFDAEVGEWGDEQTVVPAPVPTSPAGALTAGKFSVADDKQVYFSQGNLQATTTDNGTNWTWKFAANQWDYVGDAPGNNSINGNGTLSTENGTVDLFGWVGASSPLTGAAMYGISNSFGPSSTDTYGYIDDENLKSDWGTLMGSGWYTLSKDEWQYLFNTRSVNGGMGSGYSYTIGQSVNGVLGVVIYPDGYTGSLYGGTNWSDFESAGCVFLPAAGNRAGDDGSTVFNAGTYAQYWSCSVYDMYYACGVYFDSYALVISNDEVRHGGHSVRLVRQVE